MGGGRPSNRISFERRHGDPHTRLPDGTPSVRYTREVPNERGIIDGSVTRQPRTAAGFGFRAVCFRPRVHLQFETGVRVMWKVPPPHFYNLPTTIYATIL